jgi:hypothetical protein
LTEADIAQRWSSSENSWKWIDPHGKEFGIGRPYLDKDPPHVGPIDGKEFTDKTRPAKCETCGIGNEKAPRVSCERRSQHGETRKNGILEGEKHIGLLAFRPTSESNS